MSILFRLSRRGALALLGGLPASALAGAPGGKPPPLQPGEGRRHYADVSGGRCRDSSFKIVNRAEAEIVEIYVRASGQTGHWGEDRLGEAVLRRGAELQLDPGPGVQDILLITGDGRAMAAMRQNACSLATVQLEPDGRLTLT
jgi:hypothetical protein